MSGKEILNVWAKEGLRNVTFFFFDDYKGKFADDFINLEKSAICSDGKAIIVKGNMTSEDMKTVIYDCYSVLRGDVPKSLRRLYIEES